MRTLLRTGLWVIAWGISFSIPAIAGDGATIYKEKCLICHGEKGDGKGPAGAALNPPPRDFTSADYCNAKDENLMNSIKNGKRAMPPFGAVLSDEDIQKVHAFERTFCPQK